MQPQSAQSINMYVSQSTANSTGISRANPPNYRPSHTPTNSAPRNRFMANTMYLSPMQNVLPQQYSYHTRQPSYMPPYIPHSTHTHTQYFPSNAFCSYYVQQPPHLRTISVQPTSVPSVSNGGSGGVNGNTIVPAAMIGGVIQSAHSAAGVGVGIQSGTTTASEKPRPHALKIIDPDTKRNILDDLKKKKNISSAEGEVREQSTTTIIKTGQATIDSTTINNGFPPDFRKYEVSTNITGNKQTPIVSAMSNAPSVEIYTQTKTKTKKLHKDKETNEKFCTPKFDESISQKNQQQSPINVVQSNNIVHELKYTEVPQEIVPQIETVESAPFEISNHKCCSIQAEIANVQSVDEKDLHDEYQQKRMYIKAEEEQTQDQEYVPTTTQTLPVHSISHDHDDLVVEIVSNMIIDSKNIPTNTANIASIKSNEFIQIDKTKCSTADDNETSNKNVENFSHNSKISKEEKEENEKKEELVIDNANASVKTRAINNDVNENYSTFSSSNTIPEHVSPQNQGISSNNFKYDRNQLLELRNAEASRLQPNVKFSTILPGTNLMPAFASKKFPLSLIGGSRSGDGSNMQKYNYKDSPMAGATYSHNGEKGNVIHVNLLLNQDVKLSESTNAWRPRVLKKNDQSNLIDPEIKAQQEKEDIIRRVRGILNKLTPEKFDVLLEEVLKLQIDTTDKLDAVMILVFEKAIDEPNFSVCYAQLCQRLISEVTPKDKHTEGKDERNNDAEKNGPNKRNLSQFRVSLLSKIEHEFNFNVINANAKNKKLEPLKEKIKNCTDPNEKIELKALLEEEERKVRRRSGGTVCFIGELFKHNIIMANSIVSCIENLLKNSGNEDMLECLCKLLSTVGKKLEKIPSTSSSAQSSASQTQRHYLDTVVHRMHTIVSRSGKTKISSRVRFMLQDVIDLRKNKWQSTRNEIPTTMDQIEKEAHTQKLNTNYLNYALSGSNDGSPSSASHAKRDNRYNDNRNTYNGSLSQRGERGRGFGGGSGSNIGGSYNTGSTSSNDGGMWHTQTSKSSRSVTFDSNKLEAMQITNIGEKRMGGVSQFQWLNCSNQFAPLSTSESAKSCINNNDKSSDSNRMPLRNKNSYTKGLIDIGRYSERDKASLSRSSNSPGVRENFPTKISTSRIVDTPSSTQKASSQVKYDLSQPTSLFASNSEKVSSKFSSLSDNDHNKDSEIKHQESVSNAALELDDFDKLTDLDRKKFKTLASELIENAIHSPYLSEEFAYEVVSCIKQLKETQHCDFIYYILTDYIYLLEIGPMQRRHLSNCIAYLIKYEYLNVENFLLGYLYFSKCVSYLIFDVPNVWLYVYEFTGPLIVKNLINIKQLWLKEFEKYDVETRKIFLKSFLQYMKRDVGPNYTRELWRRHNLKWTDFIPEKDVANFIKENKLEYIEDEKIQAEIYVDERSEKSHARIFDHIKQLLKEGTTADRIIDYLNGNICEADRLFMRELTKTLTDYCIKYKSNSHKLDTGHFQDLCVPVLLRYINKNNALELECLYALQMLDHSLEHPRDLLRDLFMQLNDYDVISRETFLKWRDSKELSVGKGVAVKALNPFFNQVLNGETSDDN